MNTSLRRTSLAAGLRWIAWIASLNGALSSTPPSTSSVASGRARDSS